tara:strand:- start:371 stop:706 length:336 start_codon:yes stop_codon:yes gene_type:complete
MPCIKCENGLWRWGESGKCQYASISECETANADYYSEAIEYDYAFNFSQGQMEALHEEGRVLIHIEKDGEGMDILFSYDIKEEEYSNLTDSLLDDELDDYIDKLTHSIKQL